MKNVKKNGGFTLVELIVVIAILAILAAVAIPAYSGYIKKAEEANDLQLLGALNTSFNAACVENNIFDMEAMEGAEFVLSNGLVSGLKLPGGYTATVSEVTFSNDLATAILNSFELYFGDNMTTPFKTYYKLVFAKGAFDGVALGENANVQNAINNVMAALGGSVFEGNEQQIMDDVQSLTNLLKGAAGAMGAEQLGTVLGGGSFGAYLTEQGVEASDSQAVANYAMLFIADQMSGLTDEQKAAVKDAWTTNAFGYGDAMEGVKMYANLDGVSTMGGMALYYANMEACIQNLQKQELTGNDAATRDAVVAEFNKISTNMAACNGDIDAAWVALAEGYQKMANVAIADSQQEGGGAVLNTIQGYKGGSAADIDAFLNAMGTINENANDLKDLTGNDDMYSSLSSLFRN